MRTYGVAAAAGAAVHVDFLPRNGQLGHDGHRHHGEGFVDLEQVHLQEEGLLGARKEVPPQAS